MQFKIHDKDLRFLAEMSNDELSVLYKIIVEKGNITERLKSNERCKQFYPDHQKYADLIADELIAFGSHTFFFNKTYKDIAVDVCSKMNIPGDKTLPIEQLEYRLLSEVLAKAWEGMSNEQRRAMLASIGARDMQPSNATSSSILKMFQGGGGLASKLAGTAASAVAGMLIDNTAVVLGGGGAAVGGGSAMSLLAVMTGPIGIALTASVAAVGLGGPAYRVTIPATLYIGGMRFVYEHPTVSDDDMSSSQAVNPFGNVFDSAKQMVDSAANAVNESVHRAKERASTAKNNVVNAASDIADRSAEQFRAGAQKIFKAPSAFKNGLLGRFSKSSRENDTPPVSLKRKYWLAMPTDIFIGFNWDAEAALDAAIFLLGADGRVTSDEDFIFYNQPAHPSGCVVRNDEEVECFVVDFALVPDNIKTLVLSLTADENFKQDVKYTFFDLNTGKGLLRRELDMSNSLTTIVGEFERQDKGWAFNALGDNTQMQLLDLCNKYGVNVE